MDKMNRSLTPSKEELIGIVQNEINAQLKDVCGFIESALGAKAQVDYSVCSAAPGWNFKYKKSGKSVCTVYPEKDKFIILVTLNMEALEKFDIVSKNFSRYMNDLVEKTKIFNGTKWLMVSVDSVEIAQDVKKLIELKFGL